MSESAERQTQPIAVLVSSGVAYVTVLAGTAAVGSNYVLDAGELTIGDGSAGIDLSADPSISGLQATLLNEDGAVSLRCDQNNQNVFLRRRSPTPLELGDHFIVGSQRLRVAECNDDRPFTWEDGTQLFTSPRRKGSFLVEQLLSGGRRGASASNSEDLVPIGADGTMMSLAHDPTVSTAHAIVQRGEDGVILVSDQDSLNGVYTPVQGVESLVSGDLFWVGNQLLRVDISA